MAQQQAERHGKAKAFRRRAKEVLVSVAKFANRHLGEGGAVLDDDLRAAAQVGNIALISRLLKRGAKVNSADSIGDTALHNAAASEHTEACALLIQKGAHVNKKNIQDKTPLMMAAKDGNTKTCLLLIEHGANVHAIDKDCKTASSYALNPPPITPYHWKAVRILAFAELLAAANKEAPALFFKSFRECVA
jgi:ankyrin repeat protein